MCLGHEKVMEFQIDPTILDKKKNVDIKFVSSIKAARAFCSLFSPVCLTNFFLCQ